MLAQNSSRIKWTGSDTQAWFRLVPILLQTLESTSSRVGIAWSDQNVPEMISDWRSRIGIFRDPAYINLIGFKTGCKPVSCKLCRFSPMLKDLIAAVVLLTSSGVYAGGGAYLYDSTSSAVDADQASREFQHSLVSYHENEMNGAKPILLVGEYGVLTSENEAIEERSVNDFLDRKRSTVETGIGMGVTPLFDSHGVFRTSSNNDQSTYAVLGFIADKLALDEAGTSDSVDDNGLSYGFGVNKSSFNFEYMMSMDNESYEVSAVGLRFTSEF